MAIEDKDDFIEYCLRKLGKPVINIEIANEQAYDRVDEALDVYYEKHYDATENTWLYYKITSNDETNNYITLPSEVIGVYQVAPLSQFTNTEWDGGILSPQYQIITGGYNQWQQFDSLSYFLTINELNTSNDMIGGMQDGIRFSFVKHKNQIQIFSSMSEGTEYLFRVYKKLDEDLVWKDKWLKQYATALLKKQWGENVSKFGSIQLLGGVTINGDRLISEADQEIERLTEQLNEEFMEPTGFIIG